MLSYEFRKIKGSHVVLIIVALLLFFNIGHSILNCRNVLPGTIIEQVREQHAEDPESLYAYYAELQELDQQGFQQMIATSKTGEGAYIWTLPMTFDPQGRLDDLQILKKVYKQAEYQEGHSAMLGEIVRRATINHSDFLSYGFAETSYECRLQNMMINRYQTVAENIQMEAEYPYGYDTYLSHGALTIYLTLALLVVIPYVMIQDHSCGMATILRTTRHGRHRLAGIKVLTVVLLTVLLTLLFSLSSFVVVGIMVGYSSPFNAIQAFESYSRVPFVMNMAEYVGLIFFLRLLASLALSAILALIGAFSKQFFIAFGAGAVFWGFNLLAKVKTYLGTPPAVRYVNLVSMSEGVELTSVLRGTNVLGLAVGHVTLSIVATVPLIVLALWGSMHGYCSLVRVHVPVWLMQAIGKLRASLDGVFRNLHLPQLVARGTGLFRSELQKIVPRLRLVLLLLLLLAKGVWGMETYENPHFYSEAVYQQYLNELDSLSNTEQAQYMVTERERLDGILLVYTSNEEAYQSGDMSGEAWSAYLEEYYVAQVESKVFERVESLTNYLNDRRLEGYPVSYVYEAGWEKLLDASPDFFLYMAILLVAAGSFSMEYRETSSSGGFSQILKSTRRGRKHTFGIKLGTVALWSVGLALVTSVMDVILVGTNWTLPKPDMLLNSLMLFRNTNSMMTIGQYLGCVLAIRLILAAYIGVLTACLSELLRRPIPILSVAVMVTAVPYVLSLFGSKIPVVCDFLSMLGGNELYLYSSSCLGKMDFDVVGICLITIWGMLMLLIGMTWVRYRGVRLRAKGGQQ